MYCRKCGQDNPDGAVNCSNCGEPLAASDQQVQNVPNYLVWSILTIFCCWPLGIVSIVYAASVNGKLRAGDYAGAVEASNKAKMWAWISFGVGLVVNAIYIVSMIMGITTGTHSGASFH